MEAYTGAIFSNAFSFAPNGFLPCDGRSLSVQEYAALFALIGTTYGGNGVSNFNLPNLQSRVPIGTGHGAGLSIYVLGQTGGTETVTITASNMPNHTHAASPIQIPVSSDNGTLDSPISNYLAADINLTNFYSTSGNAPMAATNVVSSAVGNVSLPKEVLSPYVAVSYMICVNGLYPVKP